jgi:serine/threonine protein kinase
MCGTPNYFSPEIVNGERYGAPSDAWAVGLLLYEILTLRHPFLGGSLAALLKRICEGEYDQQACTLLTRPHSWIESAIAAHVAALSHSL